MKKLNLVLFISGVFLLFASCKKDETFSQISYNKKANELIQQIITDDSCACILEIPQESMIKTRNNEHPDIEINIEPFIVKKLHLKNTKQLDSLEKVSEKFILDTFFLKQKNIQIIKRDFVLDTAIKDRDLILLKKCPKGILCFSKPIIDERNNVAGIFYTPMFVCLGSPLYIYKFEDNRWIIKQ
ncbi:hypothetical protein ACFSJW_20340 [Flavobacterium artemisiae]|uniref:Lipoprotein n=1 Tax=Flavobacterium artemisiae TaxID=2126556 RepID=A0ABW4HBC1_9FLAO